jgi:DNA replication and repair protein RecF
MASALRRPLVRRIILRDFRSYATLDLALSGSLIALVGENGAGKTNLLEALSLFAPGRGLRRAQLGEMLMAMLVAEKVEKTKP